MELPLLGAFDVKLLELLVAARTPELDTLSHFLLGSDVRIGVLAVLLLYTWLGSDGTFHGRELRILKGCTAIVLAMVACFIARHLVPLQPRPRLALPFDFPPLGDLGSLADYRSFPSDTSCLAAAITVVVFLASRRLGWAAVAWTLLAVGLPRMYYGYHYFSDIAAGLLLGGLVAWAVMRVPVGGERLPRLLNASHEMNPPLFTLGLVLVAHQIGTMFPVLQMLGALVVRR